MLSYYINKPHNFLQRTLSSASTIILQLDVLHNSVFRKRRQILVPEMHLNKTKKISIYLTVNTPCLSYKD
jgi:hypothetical protein